MMSWFPVQEDFGSFFDSSVVAGVQNVDRDEIGSEMCETLSNFSLLYEIPFSYLVPSEKILTNEQIAFFYLDSNWIRSLLDGALSVGRNFGIDYSNDTKFIEDIYTEAMSKSADVRLGLQGKPKVNAQSQLSLKKFPICTGFILKSQLVRGWRGLEFAAYEDEQERNLLLTLRLETLSEDVLLGLFAGVIGKLNVLQPPEGLHYGFNKESGALTKTLRRLEDGKLMDKSQKSGAVKIQIFEKSDRVIDFAKVAEGMGKALNEQITSAHMALEMLQNPYMASVHIKA